MDESIRNAEKLIAAANSALAQMKNDTYYDDFFYIIDGNRGSEKNNKPVSSFKAESFSNFLDIKEKTPDAEKFSSFERKNRDFSIEEINSKIEAYKREILEKEQRKSSRALYLDRGELGVSRSKERVAPASKTTSDTNLSQRSVMKTRSLNVTEDLKSKLLQTQEIVDRGIQTAREINETVSVVRNRSLKTDRFDDISLSRSKSSEKLRKTESKSSIRSIDVKKCKKCNSNITTKKCKVQRNEENVLVTRVQGDDSNPRICKKLNFQQLPSLNIQGDLICQKIPSVNISPGKGEYLPVRSNTAFETYSHEQILSSRIDRVLDDIRRWNSFTESIGKKTNMECSNCGIVMRIRNRFIDSEQIDELLRMCDYNVFDPRIDEFVESCRVKKEEVKFTQTEEEPFEMKKQSEARVFAEERPVVEEKPKITDLSKELTRKYREKAAELESDHLEFESILKDIFQKIDESRDLFKNCDYYQTTAAAKEEKREVSLTTTKPVLLSYTGSVEEIDDFNNAVMRPRKPKKHKMSSKEIRKKLEKRELLTNCKVLSCVSPMKDSRKEDNHIQLPTFATEESQGFSLVANSKKESVSNECQVSVDNKKGPVLNVVKEPVASLSESKQSLKSDFVTLEEVKPANTESEYESDFEEESLDEVPIPVEKDVEDNSYVWTARLSTITEVDSDVNRSDTAKDKKEEDLIPETQSVPGEENVKGDEPVQNQTLSVSSNSSGDDTAKLVKKVNRDLEEVATLSGRRVKIIKEVPNSITEPLKEVLDALKNQFERTELLADKLTESIKEVKHPEELSEICRRRDIIYNLRKSRKNVEKSNISTKPDLLDPSYTVSLDEDVVSGKSSGELVIQNGQQGSRLSDDVSVVASIPDFVDKSYSEGEISELEVMGSQVSSPSVGEVVSENHSNGSERNPNIKFP